MKRRQFVGGALAALGALALGKLPKPAAAPALVPFAEGTFLHIDGGTLELGLVRDSITNARNDFFLFGESFMVNGEHVSPLYVTTAHE